MRVALFVPCFVDQMAPEVGVATARILRRLGHDVSYPAGQTCCGQPAMNAGHFDEARRVAARQLDALAEGDPDAVVAPSGSCVTALAVEAKERLGLDHPVLDRLFELSSFLVDRLGVDDVGARFCARVAWHDACHPLRRLGIREAPRRLLGKVEGLDLIELSPPDECCGFGGTFSVKFPDLSVAIGERKVRAIEAARPDVVASTETSCLLQIGGLLRRRKSRIRALHLAEILGGDDA
jgi:L-lactate dehydrogenase complex protein LldE